MKCTNCESELEPGVKSCDHCGAPVEPSPPRPPVVPAPPSPTPADEEPAFLKSIPPAQSSAAFLDSDKVLGIDKGKMGLASLILGIVGLVLSCLVCGGLIGLLGIVAGVLGLKTHNRRQATLGLVLSGLGFLVSLIFACIYAFALSGD